MANRDAQTIIGMSREIKELQAEIKDLRRIRGMSRNEAANLAYWLLRPNGAYEVAGLTFEAVEGGRVWIRA